MRLLWLSNDPRLLFVGQSRVTREILARLHGAGIEVHAAGPSSALLGCQVPYPVHVTGPLKDYPKQLISDLKPDCIVCSHDCWLFYWLEQCKKDFPAIKLVGYYTIDGGPIHGSWLRTMRPLDLLTTPTQFGKEQIYQRYPEKHVAVIPYGLDSKFFSIEQSKDDEKKSVDAKTVERIAGTGQLAITLANKCVFCYVGQNQGRKNVAAILEGFEKADLPKSHLMMVTHCTEVEIGGWRGIVEFDLIDLVGTFEHRERITIQIDPASEDAIRALYRCSDYFVLPSQGEAPGLPILEAMACGCIPIVTNYAGAAEIAPIGYRLPYGLIRGQFNVNRAFVSASTVAVAMRNAYKDWEQNRNPERIEACKQLAQSYSWEKTSILWLQYLKGMIDGNVLVDTEVEACL